MKIVGFDRCFFFGLTYAPEHLPMSEHSPAGHMTPAQKKLKLSIVEQFDKVKRRENSEHPFVITDSKINFLNSILETINGDNPPTQTINRKHFTDWKKRLRERLGFLPKILGVGEYGERGGRAHYHAVILNLTPEQAKTCADCWPWGTVDTEPVREESVGGYISKDIVKSTWSKDRYTAAGREAPFMTWPVGKGRGLAAGQEESIFNALSTMQKACTAERFEYLVQTKHYARSYTVHTPPKDGPAVDPQGKSRGKNHNVRFSRTAYKRALARIDRNPAAQEFAAKVAAQNAHLEVEHTDLSSRFYLEEHDLARTENLERAKRVVEKAKRNHNAILERKRRTGAPMRRPSKPALEAR